MLRFGFELNPTCDQINEIVPTIPGFKSQVSTIFQHYRPLCNTKQVRSIGQGSLKVAIGRDAFLTVEFEMESKCMIKQRYSQIHPRNNRRGMTLQHSCRFFHVVIFETNRKSKFRGQLAIYQKLELILPHITVFRKISSNFGLFNTTQSFVVFVTLLCCVTAELRKCLIRGSSLPKS